MQDKILDLLAETYEFVSGQEISEKCGVSRQAISKHIKNLRESGFEIDAVTNKGYRLISYPDYINPWSLKRFLKTKKLGKNVVFLNSVDSTNNYLKQLANSGCTAPTVVVAREQTKGKGRLGRAWQSKKDECITFSVLLRPQLAPTEISAITPLVGLAVCRAIREFTGLDCKIKWPNDIIVGRKKLSGILTEVSAEFDAVEYVIIGIGINFDNAEFPEEISEKATSVFLESGKCLDKNEFFASLLLNIENIFEKTDYKLNESVIEEYGKLCATLGRNISFLRSGRRINAVAIGIDQSGELKARLSDKTQLVINSGEVTVQGIY